MISTFTSHMDLFRNPRIIRLLLLLTRSKNMFSSGIISVWRQWGQGSTGCCWWSYNNPGNPVPTYHSLLAAGDKSWTLPSHQVSTLTQNSDLPLSLSKAKLFLCDNWQGDNTVLDFTNGLTKYEQWTLLFSWKMSKENKFCVLFNFTLPIECIESPGQYGYVRF